MEYFPPPQQNMKEFDGSTHTHTHVLPSASWLQRSERICCQRDECHPLNSFSFLSQSAFVPVSLCEYMWGKEPCTHRTSVWLLSNFEYIRNLIIFFPLMHFNTNPCINLSWIWTKLPLFSSMLPLPPTWRAAHTELRITKADLPPKVLPHSSVSVYVWVLLGAVQCLSDLLAVHHSEWRHYS